MAVATAMAVATVMVVARQEVFRKPGDALRVTRNAGGNAAYMRKDYRGTNF
jgi:hypothetical protein